MKPFLDALLAGPLLFDGAMGSLLYERGVFLTRSYDELNLSQPALVSAIHRDYLAAGADILETNTFGANRIALARHGFSDRARAINQAAVALCREVAGDKAYVAGAVGPTGIPFAVATAAERKLAEEALGEQITALFEAGIDLVVLETYQSIVELETAIAVARAHAPGLPIVAQAVFDQTCKGDGGLAPEAVARRLAEAGADVVGANCGAGPPELYEVGTKMTAAGKPVSIQPNAGLPSIVEGRTIYVANPEHFGVFARRLLKAGVKLVGGCCGTTPAHTRSMLGAVRMMSGGQLSGDRGPAEGGQISGSRASDAARMRGETSVPADRCARTVPAPADALEQKSRLGARLVAGDFAVSVELPAPAGVDPAALYRQIDTLLQGGVDIINIADGPRATCRTSNMATCSSALRTGVEPILHVCCRDRNILGLVSHLLGAHALGIRNLVIITGDPPKMGDFPFATPVYDVDSIGLLEIAAGLNAGIDPAGKDIGGHTSFLLATGAEPAAQDYDRELLRLEKKRAAGAELIMTQPVYDPATLDRFLTDVAPLGIPVMVGLLPLASHRNAEFLHNEVPGMQIPAVFRERMAKVGSGPAARAEGIAIAREALSAVVDRVAGAYIMPPFGRVDSALAILEAAGQRWRPVARSAAVSGS